MNNFAWQAAKIFLQAAAPVQQLIDDTPGDTHIFLNNQAVKILYNDGYHKISKYLRNYLQDINRGVLWADKGWKNFSHYLNPYTGKGIWPWPNAKSECNYYFKKTIKYWQKGLLDKCMFYLGAAVHLVQDMCVPHHARGAALSGHSDYERWVQRHYMQYAVNHNGLYNAANSVDEWININAKLSWAFFPQVCKETPEANYHRATSILLTRAQRSTAGFMLYFMNTITKV
ncbi:phospholipase C [Desulfohalotomaculum tongense]|uniref:zinc dependent phospholipase C family protein n=1 Tax=Desulforadius tongensis TaxID=1216062 RepID=UPI001959536A|nr:zinc dependent phospholipase C family protein [Desulforadius tongensis]MBM7854121.1 phospholipase C [Desulforadius tongensis]